MKIINNICYVLVKKLDVYAVYESGKVKCYRNPEDLPRNLKGVQPLPKTVKRFMIENPDKVLKQIKED